MAKACLRDSGESCQEDRILDIVIPIVARFRLFLFFFLLIVFLFPFLLDNFLKNLNQIDVYFTTIEADVISNQRPRPRSPRQLLSNKMHFCFMQ